MNDHTLADCGVCGRRLPADWMLRLRPAPSAGMVAHCPDCIAAWRRGYEQARERGME